MGWTRMAIAIVALIASSAATGAVFTPDPVDLAAAKKEGTVSWYTSTPIESAQKIARLFERETGVKVQLFRSGGSAVVRRFMQEVDAGKVIADVVTVSDPAAMSVMIKRGLLVPFRPMHFDKIPAEAKDPQGYHVAQRLNLLAIVARTDRVAPADLPRSWTDLVDPKYKGKMVMPDPSFTANQLMVVGTLSQKYGWDFYRKLRANDTMIVQGHQQVSDTLKSGERVLAAEGADAYTWSDRQAGHKVQTIFPVDGAFVVPAPTAIIKGSPHPNAAKALAEFMLGDGTQALLTSDGSYAARTDIEPPAGSPPLAKLRLLAVDYDYIEREAANIKQRFNEIFQ